MLDEDWARRFWAAHPDLERLIHKLCPTDEALEDYRDYLKFIISVSGKCDLDSLKEAIEEHPYRPKPPPQHIQELLNQNPHWKPAIQEYVRSLNSTSEKVSYDNQVGGYSGGREKSPTG